LEWKEVLWDKYVTAAPRTADRQWFAQQTMRGDARHQSNNTAIASYNRGAEPRTWHQFSDFLDACNYARRLKTLSGLTPY
jgi:hypothetical protein